MTTTWFIYKACKKTRGNDISLAFAQTHKKQLTDSYTCRLVVFFSYIANLLDFLSFTVSNSAKIIYFFNSLALSHGNSQSAVTSQGVAYVIGDIVLGNDFNRGFLWNLADTLLRPFVCYHNSRKCSRHDAI